MSEAVQELMMRYQALSVEEQAEFEESLHSKNAVPEEGLQELLATPEFRQMLQKRLMEANDPAKLRDGPTVMAHAKEWLQARQK